MDTMNNDAQTQPPATRFLLFEGDRGNQVVRDLQTKTDYPFSTRPNALKGIDVLKRGLMDLIGSPSRMNVYGYARENVEARA